MPDTLKHGFHSDKPDGTDPNKLQPSHWNAEHQFSGGTNGQVLVFDDTKSDKVRWADSAAPAAHTHPTSEVTGYGQFADGAQATPSITFAGDPDTGFFRRGSGIATFSSGGSASVEFGRSVLRVSAGSSIAWSSSGFSLADDVRLFRDGAGVLALKNAANAQEFRVYGTTTGPKFASLKSDTNGNFVIGTKDGTSRWYFSDTALLPAAHNTYDIGAGATRVKDVYVGGALYAGSVVSGAQSVGGNLTFGTDNTYDIGASGATRPKNIYAAQTVYASNGFSGNKLTLAAGTIADPALNIDSTATWNDAADTFTAWKLNVTDTASAAASLLLDLQVGGASRFNVTKAGTAYALASLYAGSASNIGWSSRGYLYASGDGLFVLSNWAANDFSRLMFGGTTASFPALKRVGAGLSLKFADDSDYTAMTVGALTAITSVTVGATAATTGAVRLTNATAINWRNAANSADVGVTLNASNEIDFGSAPIRTTGKYYGDGSLLTGLTGAALGVANVFTVGQTIAPITYNTNQAGGLTIRDDGSHWNWNLFARSDGSGNARFTIGRDTTEAFILDATGAALAGSLRERGRTVAMGEWIAPAFNAGDFTASASMTWTVEAPDVATYAYTLVGKTMTVAFSLDATTIGGTPDKTLYIAIPGGYTAAKLIVTTCRVYDNYTTNVMCFCYVASAGNKVAIARFDAANFTASTNRTAVQGQITFEVQ